MAVLAAEPDGDAVANFLDTADRRVMSAATVVELGIVLSARFGPVGTGILERFLRAAEVDVAAIDREQADLAIDAWQRFGRGNHPANLNYGDCFTYALAAVENSAILCTGEDFSQTDLPVVQPDRRDPFSRAD